MHMPSLFLDGCYVSKAWCSPAGTLLDDGLWPDPQPLAKALSLWQAHNLAHARRDWVLAEMVVCRRPLEKLGSRAVASSAEAATAQSVRGCHVSASPLVTYFGASSYPHSVSGGPPH